MAGNWVGMPMRDPNTNKMVFIKKIRLKTNNGLYFDCDCNNNFGLFKRDREGDQLPKSTEWKVLWKEGNTCKLMSCYGSLLTFRDKGPLGLLSRFFNRIHLTLECWPVFGDVADWHLDI